MRDSTRNAVIRQVDAMGAEIFEVGVFDAAAEKMIPRTWNKETLLKSIAWLRFENLQGRNIYIRPAGIHFLSLVDDLKPEAVKNMKDTGFSPAAVVETSHENFQVWLQHGRVLEKPVLTAAAKALALRFGGDQGSADWRHFGRLAGFTNRKEKHRQPDGFFPYVRLLEATGVEYSEAAMFLHEVEDELEARKQSAFAAREFFRNRPGQAVEITKSIDDFRYNPRYGGAQSRSDLAYAVYALGHGVSENTVRSVIASQDLSFKGTTARQGDYIDRVIEKATAFLQRTSLER
jgi:hypothetical protein